MQQIEIKNRFTNQIIIAGKYENIKDCLEKNRGADLRGANLRGADLEGAKNYSWSHDFFIQIIRNNMDKFTQREQEICAYIFAYRICWKEIKKQYKTQGLKIGKKLTKLGFDEFEKEFKKK